MKQTCKEIVAEILPSTGAWWGEYRDLPLGSDKLFFENIPYHACDIKWLKKYIRNNLLKQCSFIKFMAVNKYLNSDEFLQQIKDYQYEIIDWQIFFSDTHHMDMLTKLTNKNAKKEVDTLFKKVYEVLTEVLKMDKELVGNRLKELKPDRIKNLKKYHKNKEILNFGLCNFSNVDESKYGEI